MRDARLTPRPFYFLRHGQTDWNLKGVAQGHTDVPLNERGIEQAEIAGEALEGIELAGIVHSPLARARDTAWVVNERLGLPMAVVEDLKECGWGVAEGTNLKVILDDWKQGHVIQGGEPYNAFMLRALRGINQALEIFPDGPVLIIAHGGIFWSIRHFAKLDPEFSAPNCVPMLLRPQDMEGHYWEHQVFDLD